MKTERCYKLGLILIVCLGLGAPELHAAELSNITLGRFQDFTVVTLFGDENITVTHQIVEAKEGKPHRIVVDLAGTLHNLPQNNFANLPEGTISRIRTSQFAVSPDPVVRVVLDLKHPAAYRLETPGNNVRIMVSLPGDPPIGRVWAAKDATSLPLAPSADDEVVLADAGSEAKPGSSPAKEPMRAKKADQPDGRPAGVNPATDPAMSPDAGPAAKSLADASGSEPKAKAAPAATQPAREAQSLTAGGEDPDLPKVPLPMPARRPEQTIDYNLPVPAALAGAEKPQSEPQQAKTGPDSKPGTSSLPLPAPAPKLVTKSADREPELKVAKKDAAPQANPAKGDPATQATDQGSAPVASLTTLPPLKEATPKLVPQRTKVVYNTQGRRDPFKALLQSGGYNAAALPDVGSLRLVGLLHDVQESWGLFEDANGYGFILRKGDRVKNGRLTKLTNNRAYFRLTEFGWSRSVQIDLEPEG